MATWWTPRRFALLFVASNFLFLVGDIYLAHSYNHFAVQAEWIPLGYSLIAGFWLLLYVLRAPRPGLGRRLMHGALWLGVAVGIAGFLYHLHGATFREFTLKTLVYAAPLAAPLAYTGLSLTALVADGAFARFGEFRKRGLFLLAGAGFFGNVALSVLDHARNGFFFAKEWAAVFVSAFVCVTLCWAGVKRALSREDIVAVHAALGAAFVTGIAGFVFHLTANLHNVMPDWYDKFVYGAPVFAPLLFCDIAALGLLAVLVNDAFDGWLG